MKSTRKVWLTGAAVAIALVLSLPVQANLVVNAGFETGDSPWTYNDAYRDTCAGSYPGCAPGGGSYFGFLNNSAPVGQDSASVSQTIALPGDGLYEFGMWVSIGTTAKAGNFDVADFTLAIQPSGPYPGVRRYPNDLTFPIAGAAGFSWTNWFLMSATYLNTAGSTNALVNVNVQDFDATDTKTIVMVVDNVFVQLVPEPATVVLLGLGLAGLGFSRRKV